MRSVQLLIVIVNYRTPQLAIDCLESLRTEVSGYAGCRVIVVDNASGDGSAEKLSAAVASRGWTGWAQVIASPVNGGFAAGNNLAIRAAREAGCAPSLIWMVNPDAVVRPGALDALVEFMSRHPQAGIAGGSLEDGSGKRWPFAFRFPSLWSEIDNGLRLGIVSRWLERFSVVRRMGDEPQRVDWISGANFMLRGTMVDQIGLIDEHYFLYFEETDYCRRALASGWECWYVPSARVMHMAGQSTGVVLGGDAAPQRRRPAYWFESRRRFFVKNHGRTYAALVDLAWLVCFALWRLRRRLQGKSDDDPPGMMIDFVRHSVLRHPFARLDPGP